VSRGTACRCRRSSSRTKLRFLGKGWPLARHPAFPLAYRVRLGRRFDPPADVRAFTLELERYFARELACARPRGRPRMPDVESATHPWLNAPGRTSS
jgi:hypothetical protein